MPSENPKDVTAFHAKEGDLHFFGAHMKVLMVSDDGSWFAQGLDIDFAAQGATLEEAKKNFFRVPRIGGGLMAVYEVLIATSPVRNLVREGKTNQIRNAMQMGLSAGHKTIEMSLIELVNAGMITQETAVNTAFVPHEIDPSISVTTQH